MIQNSAPHAFAAAAQSLIGTPFRLHGRDPVTGLDCVGLVGAALKRVGRQAIVPAGYQLRNRSIEKWFSLGERNGFGAVEDAIKPGDLLLCLTGPAQYHLVISAPDGDAVIHAHAGLRRVVATPGPLAWPPLKHWRLAATSGD